MSDDFDRFLRAARAGDADPQAEESLHDLAPPRFTGHQYAEWKRTTEAFAHQVRGAVSTAKEMPPALVTGPAQPDPHSPQQSFLCYDGNQVYRVTISREE